MNGIIVINKSKGCTSHDIVKRAKRILNKKVGHTGTLDPNATGVLPLLVGKGTQISKYIINHDKTYEAILQLGTKTDTADGEGNILETEEVSEESLQQINIDKVFKSLIGKQNQVPPMYSAIKVNGKKLYEYARRGEHVEIQPRTIEIYNIELIRTDLQNKTIEFRVYCSKGTYIRTLCENIAERLHTIGYMKELNRIKVGEFKIEDSIRIEELEKNIHNNFITIEEYFDKSKSIELDNKRLQLFLNGVQLTWKLEDGVYKVYSDSQFIGIGTIKNSLLKRDIIL